MDVRAPRALDAGLALVLGAGLVIAVAIPVQGIPGEVGQAFAAVVFQQAAFLAAAAATMFFRRLDPAALGLRRATARQLRLAFAGTVGVSLALAAVHLGQDWLFRRLGLDFSHDLEESLRPIRAMSEANLPLSVILVSALPAVSEEALFRGVVMSGLAGSVGPRRGLVYAALLFAAAHLSLPRVTLTFALGLWFGALLLRTGSLWAAVAAHFANNLTAMLLPELEPGVQAGLGGAGALVAVAAWTALGRLQGPQGVPRE